MAGYIGSKAVNLSTTGADINGNANIDGTLTSDGLTVDGDGQINQTSGNASTLTFTSNGQASRFSRIKVDTDRSLILTAGVGAVNETPDIKLQTGTATGEKDRILIDGATGDISFYEDTGTTAKFFWDASAESLGIGTSSPARTLEVYSSAPAIKLNNGTNAFTIGTGAFVDGSNSLVFFDEGVGERMRIDESGKLLVGKTSDDNTAIGLVVNGNGYTKIVRASATANVNSVLSLNRLTSDGIIIDFQKDGTSVGGIGVETVSGSGYPFICNTQSGSAGLYFAGRIQPTDHTGDRSDNTVDLGFSSFRFDDIYATNGTIQTSDRNEKQDIAELSDAEQRVAVAAKGLMRKFRWRDAVAEKGDEARTHFGIIAQDLQAAFAAEGLDAGDYAMFISSTWTDEKTGEERTRMGVRYSELLAFIIGAL
jgi:hypothetical protein